MEPVTKTYTKEQLERLTDNELVKIWTEFMFLTPDDSVTEEIFEREMLNRAGEEDQSYSWRFSRYQNRKEMMQRLTLLETALQDITDCPPSEPLWRHIAQTALEGKKWNP